MRSPPRTIVIVGGGFCGTVLAAHLLRHPPAEKTRVVLVERRQQIGRGVAYQAGRYPCLLNVPAGRMSADAADPMQFVRFAKQGDAGVTPEDFLPRQLYGEYLLHVLDSADRAADSRISLERIHGQVYELHRVGAMGPFLVGISNRQRILADDIVLACGDPPPLSQSFAAGIESHDAYVCDPFSDGAPGDNTQTLLLIGTGLTMADVAVTAAARHPQIQIHAISRHGILPTAQSSLPMAALDPRLLGPLSAETSTRRLLSAFRLLVSEVEKLGGDWRDAVTATRHAIPNLWRQLPEAERGRFLRHLRTRWDACRHRLPPAIAERLTALRQSGQLHIHAGHINEAHSDAAKLCIHWRPRGTADVAKLAIDRVINCTGADHRLAKTRDPLLRSLLDNGVGTTDALGLGFRTDRHGALIDCAGRAASHLFYLGPMLRSEHWEATAVGELRDHAQQLAQKLTHSPPLARA